MLEKINVSVDAMRQPKPSMPTDVVNNIFKVFHGFYGNLFLSKFSTGEVGADGADAGVVSARMIWGHGLRDFDAQTVKAALAQCMDTHPEFPPSLPQFAALCAARKPRDAYKPVQQIGMSPEIRSAHAAKAREIIANLQRKPVEAATEGLGGLKQAIANAVACAGGDEAKELARLDRMLAPKVAA